MQTWSGQNNNRAPALSHKMITTVLILFSIAGLIGGFAVGGFRGRANTNHNPAPVGQVSTVAVAHTPQDTSDATPVAPINQTVGYPVVLQITYAEKADGTTSYTFSAKAVDGSQKAQNITATDVTCKLWLTQDVSATNTALKNNNYALPGHVDQIKQTIPSETTNALAFSATTPQIQTCAPNGKTTTWTYTLSPTLQAGQYHFFVLADWEGKHYNWYVEDITIAKAS